MLTKVLEKDPHNISALFNLGVIYADFLKKPGDALPLFKRFLSDAPSESPGASGRGKVRLGHVFGGRQAAHASSGSQEGR